MQGTFINAKGLHIGSEEARYGFLNFQRKEVIDHLVTFLLKERPHKDGLLELRGPAKIGKEFALRTAAYHVTNQGHSTLVHALDFNGFNPESGNLRNYLEHFEKSCTPFQKSRVKELTKEIGGQAPNTQLTIPGWAELGIGLATALPIKLILNLVKRWSDVNNRAQYHLNKRQESEEFSELLREATKEQALIIYVAEDECGNPILRRWLLNGVKRLQNLTVAFACQGESPKSAYGTLSPTQITFTPYRVEEIGLLFSEKLETHELPASLLKNLHAITKGVPVLLATRFFELLDAEVLVKGRKNVWQVSEEENAIKELASILEKGGFYSPIETLLDKLQDKGKGDLAYKLEQFFHVASVCGKNIPFDAIINFLEISEDTADQLEDLLTDELLDEQGSPILTYLGKTLQDFGQIEIYQFANESMPMVIQEAGAGTPVLGIAQRFYQFLKQHLPIQNCSIAKLHLAVVRHAEQSDDEEMLALTCNWWVSQVHVEDFKEELLQQCNNQSLDAETLWISVQ